MTLIAVKLLKTFSAFKGNWRSITVFKKKRTWKYPYSDDSSLKNKAIFKIQFNIISPKSTNKNVY